MRFTIALLAIVALATADDGEKKDLATICEAVPKDGEKWKFKTVRKCCGRRNKDNKPDWCADIPKRKGRRGKGKKNKGDDTSDAEDGDDEEKKNKRKNRMNKRKEGGEGKGKGKGKGKGRKGRRNPCKGLYDRCEDDVGYKTCEFGVKPMKKGRRKNKDADAEEKEVDDCNKRCLSESDAEEAGTTAEPQELACNFGEDSTLWFFKKNKASRLCPGGKLAEKCEKRKAKKEAAENGDRRFLGTMDDIEVNLFSTN